MIYLSILILFTFMQEKPIRDDGMVNCTIIALSSKVTLQCAQDENLILDIAPKEWPESWERVFKLNWNYAAMYEKGKLRAVKTPPLHVNGPCERPHHKKGEGNIRPSNCIVTP